MFRKLWNWIKSWFVKTNPEDRYDLYSPGERMIYSYFDGQKTVRKDPLRLYKKMMEKGPELSVDMKVAISPSKDAVKAEAAVVAKVKEIFDIKSFDESNDCGLTDVELIDLFNHFLVYTEIVKKNSRNSVTSWEPTRSEPTSSSTAENQTTQNGLVCGSTKNESFTEPLTLSPSESPTLSVS